MSIQRYGFDYDGILETNGRGHLVRYDDHVAKVERLSADLAAARAERDGLAKALRKGRDFLASASADQWNDATGLLHEFEDMTSVALAALPTAPEREGTE